MTHPLPRHQGKPLTPHCFALLNSIQMDLSRSLWRCRDNLCEILRLLKIYHPTSSSIRLGTISTISRIVRENRRRDQVVCFQTHKPFQGCRPGCCSRTHATHGNQPSRSVAGMYYEHPSQYMTSNINSKLSSIGKTTLTRGI